MTQEDKQLLLIDLCARLPYDVMVDYDSDIYILNEIDPACKNIDFITVRIQDENRQYCAESVLIENIKPFLRPMSSMTEEERKEVGNLIKENRPNPYGIINNKGIDNLLFSVSVTSGVLNDWLNEHHFDYRGLIEKGLAIEITEENNPYED